MSVGGAAWVTPALEPQLLPRAPRNNDEARLQRAVHQYLEWALPTDAVHFAIPNGLMRSKQARARAIGEGVLAGVPDIEVIWRGRGIFIELKAPRGTLFAAQRLTHRKLIYCGCPVHLCRSVPEVEAALRANGVPLRGQISI